MKDHPNYPEFIRHLTQLSLMSHAATMALDQHGGRDTSTSIGGNRPSGGIDVKGDLTPEFRQKSATYFVRRYRKVRTAQEFEALAAEAGEAVRSWTHTPIVAGVEPERGSFRWKCAIADDTRPLRDVQNAYWVSPATVYRYRAKYKGLMP